MPEKRTEKDTRIITGDGNITGGQNVSEIKTTETRFYGSVTGPIHTGSGNINIRPVTGAYELQRRFKELESRQASWNEYSDLFRMLAEYFLQSLPSEIDKEMILSVEGMLNSLYLHSLKAEWKEYLTDALSEALALSSKLSYVTKQSYDSPYKAGFFRTIKKLGRMLDLMSAL